MKLESFYNLLVKEITTDIGNGKSDDAVIEDDGNQSSEIPTIENETAATAVDNIVSIEIENRKDVIEIAQKFLNKTNFYTSYLIRAILDLLIGIGAITWLYDDGISVTSKVRSFYL